MCKNIPKETSFFWDISSSVSRSLLLNVLPSVHGCVVHVTPYNSLPSYRDKTIRAGGRCKGEKSGRLLVRRNKVGGCKAVYKHSIIENEI